MARFMEFVEEFKTLPPVHEIQRAQVLLPGDKGYPKKDKRMVDKVVKDAIKPSGEAPVWLKNAVEKAERKRRPNAG